MRTEDTEVLETADEAAKSFDVEKHVEELNAFGSEGLWQMGQYLVERLLPVGSQYRQNKDQILEQIASHPKARHPYAFLKQCLSFYTVYPDLPTDLPEVFYFDLSVRVFDSELREQYAKEAVDANWNITKLRKSIRDGVLERREQRRNELGFDLQVTNCWYFNSADPRFGNSHFKGRIAGQIIANSLYFYTQPDDVVLDPFAGGGTLGDVIEKLDCFQSLSYRMYDLKPTDSRINKNDVLMGLPEDSQSINYIFLDPPYGSIPKGYYTSDSQDFSQMTNEAFIDGIRGLIRECARVLKDGGKVSVVTEPYIRSSSFYDLPTAVGTQFKAVGFEQVGKVYLPNQTMRRGGMMPYIIETAKRERFMLSDCRELLTFQKPKSG